MLALTAINISIAEPKAQQNYEKKTLFFPCIYIKVYEECYCYHYNSEYVLAMLLIMQMACLQMIKYTCASVIDAAAAGVAYYFEKRGVAKVLSRDVTTLDRTELRVPYTPLYTPAGHPHPSLHAGLMHTSTRKNNHLIIQHPCRN